MDARELRVMVSRTIVRSFFREALCGDAKVERALSIMVSTPISSSGRYDFKTILQ